MTPSREVWSKSVGFVPHKVTVYESPRDGILTLRWRPPGVGNWRKKSLRRTLRTVRGKIDPDLQKWALEQASAHYAKLVAGLPLDERDVASAPLSLAEGLTRICDRQTGKYPENTPHRREVSREIERAIALWSSKPPVTMWAQVKRAELRRLWRARIEQLAAAGDVGLRGAEITVQRVLAVAAWLRDEELIPADACIASKHWRQELRGDWLVLTDARALPEPKRPRHTLDEMRKIIAVAGRVDPRLELLLALGAELRPGQVIRAMRSDVDLEHATFTVRGRGHKKGVVLELTDGQLRVVKFALDRGYLRDLEKAAADYPLFPAGQLKGGRKGDDPVATVERHLNAKSLDRSVIDDWFHEAEDLASVTKQKGRAAYGLRRAAVDGAKALGISREGLMAHGGWTDTQMPDRVYADQQAEYARKEAKTVRAKLRGEPE